MASKKQQFFAELLAPLGFQRYRDYLKSPLWAGIRFRVFDTKGRTCLRCKTAPATQIHHTKYDLPTMRGDMLTYLVPICDACHENEHPEHANRPPRKPRCKRKPRKPASERQRKAKPAVAVGSKPTKQERRRQQVSVPTDGWSKAAIKLVAKIERLQKNGVSNFRAFGIPDAVAYRVKHSPNWQNEVAGRLKDSPVEGQAACIQCGGLVSKKETRAGGKVCKACQAAAERALDGEFQRIIG